MPLEHSPQRYDVIVIGGGQAGLSVGYFLAKQHRRFVILDANARVGDSWRHRWDSLRLFTPAKFDGLAGLPFPGDPNAFPTKNEMADYLETYAQRFELPVRNGVRVTRLAREGDSYLVDTTAGRFEAPQVVVAMSTYQEPKRPAWTRELAPGIVQIDSRDYKNPSQLRDGDVLLVGAGNSGAEIAMELSRTRRVWLSGRDTGHVPVRLDSLAGRVLLPLLFRVVFHRILTIRTPMGRKARHRMLTQGGPLIRIKPKDLEAAGVQRVPRATASENGLPLLADGRRLDVTNVIWCTGFHGGFSWIDLPVIDSAGEPRHEAGVVREEPGLYFVGLHFLYSFSSTMIHGIARDAERIAMTIGTRLATGHRVGSGFSRTALAGQ